MKKVRLSKCKTFSGHNSSKNINKYKEEKDEKEALSLVKQLVQPGRLSVSENDVNSGYNKFLFNFLNIHEKIRKIDLDDIE